MNLEDRIAILKMAGYEISEVPEHKNKPEEYYAWVIQKDLRTPDQYDEADDDLEHLVQDAWFHYEDKQNEMAREVGDPKVRGI